MTEFPHVEVHFETFKCLYELVAILIEVLKHTHKQFSLCSFHARFLPQANTH